MSSSHFAPRGRARPRQPGRFVDLNLFEAIEMLPGLSFRPVLGEQMLVNFVTFEPHTEAPVHVHSEEQIVVVLDGELEFTIDGATRVMRRGDIAVIPPWVPHGARTGDLPCREFDLFTPPRATLVEQARAQIESSRVVTPLAGH